MEQNNEWIKIALACLLILIVSFVLSFMESPKPVGEFDPYVWRLCRNPDGTITAVEKNGLHQDILLVEIGSVDSCSRKNRKEDDDDKTGRMQKDGGDDAIR